MSFTRREWGISFFPTQSVSLEELRHYWSEVYALGARELFCSLHIPEADFSLQDFRHALELARQVGLSVVADVSLAYRERATLLEDCLDVVRLDFGFSRSQVEEFFQNWPSRVAFELNISYLSLEELLYWKKNAPLGRLRFSHNYYPRPQTGLSASQMSRRHAELDLEGKSIAAFIHSPLDQTAPRAPIFLGLPTLEEHRHCQPLIASQALWALGCNKVFFADPQTPLSLLQKFAAQLRFLEEKEQNSDARCFLIPLSGLGKIPPGVRQILRGQHSLRYDSPLGLHRSLEARSYLPAGSEISPSYGMQKRQAFSLCIDNALYGRYQGELQILLEDFEPCSKVNLIADLSSAAPLLRLLKGGDCLFFDFDES